MFKGAGSVTKLGKVVKETSFKSNGGNFKFGGSTSNTSLSASLGRPFHVIKKIVR